MVVCCQLGLGFVSNVFQEIWYWYGDVNSNKVVMSGVKCLGMELFLVYCCYDGEDVVCFQGGVQYGVGVVCLEIVFDLVFNVEMVQQIIYLEDWFMFMLQCVMEENCFLVLVVQIDFIMGYCWFLCFFFQIYNNGQFDFWFKNGCYVWIWYDCYRYYYSMEVFIYYDLLNFNGIKVVEGYKVSFCLEDIECEGDIQKNYECVNFGDQGIIMGCWDMYCYDIDCQWVDIIDVFFGDYLFQVVINFNFEVVEFDYFNNIMKCRSCYDGYCIWMYNCYIGGFFSEEMEKKFEYFSGFLNNQLFLQ